MSSPTPRRRQRRGVGFSGSTIRTRVEEAGRPAPRVRAGRSEPRRTREGLSHAITFDAGPPVAPFLG